MITFKDIVNYATNGVTDTYNYYLDKAAFDQNDLEDVLTKYKPSQIIAAIILDTDIQQLLNYDYFKDMNNYYFYKFLKVIVDYNNDANMTTDQADLLTRDTMYQYINDIDNLTYSYMNEHDVNEYKKVLDYLKTNNLTTLKDILALLLVVYGYTNTVILLDVFTKTLINNK